MSEVARVKPRSLRELQEVVEDFVFNMEEELVRKICRNVKKRAEMCVAQKGGNFEHLLK